MVSLQAICFLLLPIYPLIQSDFQELIPLHRDPSLPDPFFRDMAKTRGSGLSCSGLILCLSFNLIFLFVSCCNNFIFKGWSTYSERLEKRIASLRDNKWTQFEVDLHNQTNHASTLVRYADSPPSLSGPNPSLWFSRGELLSIDEKPQKRTVHIPAPNLDPWNLTWLHWSSPFGSQRPKSCRKMCFLCNPFFHFRFKVLMFVFFSDKV